MLILTSISLSATTKRTLQDLSFETVIIVAMRSGSTSARGSVDATMGIASPASVRTESYPQAHTDTDAQTHTQTHTQTYRST